MRAKEIEKKENKVEEKTSIKSNMCGEIDFYLMCSFPAIASCQRRFLYESSIPLQVCVQYTMHI